MVNLLKFFLFPYLLFLLINSNICYGMNQEIEDFEKKMIKHHILEEDCKSIFQQPQFSNKESILELLRANDNQSQVLDITDLVKQVGFISVANALIHKEEFEGFLDNIIVINLKLRLSGNNIIEFKKFVLGIYENIAIIKIKEDSVHFTPNDIILDEIIFSDIMLLHLKTGISIAKRFNKPCMRNKKLIKVFYKLIKIKKNFKEEDVMELIKISCDEARTSDEIPMNIEQAIRILLNVDWEQINKKYSDLLCILKNFFAEQNVKSEIYYLNKDDDLYFYMLKVNGKNAYMWKEYALKQREISESYTGDDHAIKKADFGIKGFLPSLYYHDQDTTETWVAFASTRPWENKNQLDYSSIEMFISMMTSKNAQFTGHVGITRAPSYIGKKHQSLSCDLHSFIAQVTLKHYTDKKYMINVPAARMREILIQKFLENDKISGVYIGDDHIEYPDENMDNLIEKRKQMRMDQLDKSDLHFRLFEQNELYINLLQQNEALEQGKLFIPLKVEKNSLNEYCSFKLFNKEEMIIHNLAPTNMSGEFAWFFESPWFVRNSRHPVVTFNLPSLAELVNFNSKIKYDTETEYIGSSLVL